MLNNIQTYRSKQSKTPTAEKKCVFDFQIILGIKVVQEEPTIQLQARRLEFLNSRPLRVVECC